MTFLKSICRSILILTGCFLFSTALYAQNWDINLLRKINPENAGPGFWMGMSNSAYVAGVGVPAGMFVTGVISKDKKTKINSYEMVGSIAFAAVITQGLKVTINRPRPYEKYDDVYPAGSIDNGKSFPSGHTTIAFATATTLALEYKKWYITVPAYAWAAGVGYSRMYLGQHYPTDVIGGAIVGTGGAFLSHWLTKKIFK
ncbi:MAG TPA: phosphatase PAP2 family protein [Panacibacter sp.]|nr:phosphatase PAP2 family protein [Panacibacter sp.]HNP45368.1 phosphatase PAP2 family protein [Panacibacter sp.]